MSRVFVTGGTGFLGRHLVPALCRAGYAMRVLTRHPAAHPWLKQYPDLEIITGDLRDAALIHQAVQGCHLIVHAAGLFSMWHEAGDFHANNVVGTEHVMQAAAASGVERVVYVSTAAVIGQPLPGRIIDERHPARPADPYQHSKFAAEQVVWRYAREKGVSALVARPGAFYGPGGDYAFNRLFFIDPMRGIVMQMDGGKYIIFPVYIGDAAEGIVLVLKKGRSGEIYNLAGDWISHRDAFDIVCQEAHIRRIRLNIPGFVGINFARLLTAIAHVTKIEPFYPIGLRSYVFNNWRVSSEKAKQELGFQPLDFREGVRRTLAWYRAGKPDTLPELRCGGPDDYHYS